ncbi:hypothetical protein BGW80DRAFT_1322517 [Lactifluus volemus]|nr:hypothetical protein BGW80DRAFT_1322517 [Lactifluus volemus]
MSTTSITHTASEVSLASVITMVHPSGPWMTLDDSESLTQLHKQLWGAPLRPQEQAGFVEKESTSNCTGFVLSIDNPIIPFAGKSIWVREEYIRIFNFLEGYYAERTVSHGMAPAAVVTGHPGIGKSIWRYYALYRCLAAKRPVLWHYNHKCYLFAESGVFIAPEDFQLCSYRGIIWTLVDADQACQGDLPSLVCNGTRLFVIYTTSPARRHLSYWDKTVDVVHIIMDPWTREEIHKAAPLLLSRPNWKAIDETYDRLGPIPQLCFWASSNPDLLELYMGSIKDALNKASQESLGWFIDRIHNAAALKTDELAYKICLVRRGNKDLKVFSSPSITPMTPFIQAKLTIALRKHDTCEEVKLYKARLDLPSCKGLSDFVFETICLRHFQNWT